MRLIDADELRTRCTRKVESSNNSDFIKAPTWNDAMSIIDDMSTVETDTVDVIMYVDKEALMEPLCEQYVKNTIARGIAHELADRIEIRSFDSDLGHMTKKFRGRVVIVKSEETREVEE